MICDCGKVCYCGEHCIGYVLMYGLVIWLCAQKKCQFRSYTRASAV